MKSQPDTLSDRELIRHLRTIRDGRSLREYARVIGVSYVYLYDVLNGNRPPGPKIRKFVARHL